MTRLDSTQLQTKLHTPKQQPKMYSDCSTKYWKQRGQKPNSLKVKIIYVSTFICAFILLIGWHGYQNHKRHNEREIQRLLNEQRRNTRPNATEIQSKLCESNMRDRVDTECTQLCKNEILSVPRPTMYQSCVHGCSRSFFAAAIIGCRMGTVDQALENGGLSSKAMISCSRFQRVEPQPYVFSTCRKYFREGTIQGRNVGNELINSLIDSEWNRIRNEV